MNFSDHDPDSTELRFGEEVTEDDSVDAVITEVTTRVARKVQIEDFEPFTVSETLTAEVSEGADTDAVSEDLHDMAKEHVQRDVMKRVEEKEMKDELEG